MREAALWILIEKSCTQTDRAAEKQDANKGERRPPTKKVFPKNRPAGFKNRPQKLGSAPHYKMGGPLPFCHLPGKLEVV